MMPTECPVPPAARKRRSSTSTLPTPSPVRWKASEAPVTPPPMMTTSAVDVTFAQRPPPQPRRRRRGGRGRPDGPSRASQRDLQADGSRPCPIVRQRRGREVLEREPDRLEERDLVRALAALS